MPEKTIRIQYYALFREECGCTDETVKTSAHTVRDLYTELAMRYSFSLPPDILRVSINNAFQSLDTILNDNDTVVFIPPVAGG